MQFAANLSMLFPAETSFSDRCRRVAEQGFQHVELLFPYKQPACEYQKELKKHGLRAVLINTPNQAGDFGYAALAGREKDFQAAFEHALQVAQTLNTRAIHVMAGTIEQDTQRNWRSILCANLTDALNRVQGTEIVLQLEALNAHDVPNYAYSDPLALLPIIEEFKHPQLGLQFDFYHTLMQGYDLLSVLERCLPYITHVQIAQPHGRTEPDLSRCPVLMQGLKMLMEYGYQGWIGLEYRPSQSFENSLDFLHQCL